jgi:Amt family ammonium transporter
VHTAELPKHPRPQLPQGLAAVTPASGFIGPVGGLCIGFVAGCVCYLAATSLKKKLGYDDSLDVFGVHGVGGFIGTVLAAVSASQVFGGNQGDLAIGRQLGVQFFACVVTIIYTAAASYGVLKAIEATIGLRVDEDAETRGLDLSLHEETGYNL